MKTTVRVDAVANVADIAKLETALQKAEARVKKLNDQQKKLEDAGKTGLKSYQRGIEDLVKAEEKAGEARKKLFDARVKGEVSHREALAKTAADQAKFDKQHALRVDELAFKQKRHDTETRIREQGLANERARIDTEEKTRKDRNRRADNTDRKRRQEFITREERQVARFTVAQEKLQGLVARTTAAISARGLVEKLSTSEAVQGFQKRIEATSSFYKTQLDGIRGIGIAQQRSRIQAEATWRRDIEAAKNRLIVEKALGKSAQQTADISARAANTAARNERAADAIQSRVTGLYEKRNALLKYRGAIEEKGVRSALNEYVVRSKTARDLYRSTLEGIRGTGIAQDGQRIKARDAYRQDMIAAKQAFQLKDGLAKEEQRTFDRNVRERERAQRRLVSDASQGFNQFSSSGAQFMGAARQPAMVGAAVGAAGIAAGLKGISSRMGVDTAETNLKIFGGEGGKDFTQAEVVQARKGFLNKMAIDHGMSISGALDAFTEVRKTIGADNAEENTKNVIAGTTGLEMPLKDTTKLLGMINRTTGNKMKPAQMKSVLNAIAVAAREDPTVAPEIVEGMKRGVGVMSMGNMTPEDLAAFVSGGQSAGIVPGKAGTFIAALGKDLSLGGAKGLDKHRKQMLTRAARAFGFQGGAKGMAQSFQTDSTGTLMKVFEKLQTMSPAQRFQSTFDLSNRMWDDEDLQFSQGFPGFKKTLGEVRDPNNANFLDTARTKRMESWQGKWNQAKTIFGLFWESFGAGFDSIFDKVTKFFVDAGTKFDFDVVSKHVEGFLTGFVNGLGFKDINALLEKVFGKPGDQKFDFVNDLKAFGQGLASGLKSVFDSVKGLMSVFTGGNPEAIGRLTGQIIGLSAALIVLSPLITVLGAVVSFVSAIAGVARMVGGIAGLAGVAGSGGAAAGTASAAALGWPIVGTLIAGAFVGYLSKMGADWAKNKVGPGVTSDAIDMFIRPGGFMGWLAEKGSNLFSDPSAEKKGAAGKVLEDATKGVTPLQKAIGDNTKIQKQSFDQSQKIGNLIKPASFSSSSSSDVQNMGARLQLAALSGSGVLSAMGISRSGAGGAGVAAAGLGTIAGSGGSAALLGATPGQALPGTGFGRRGIIGGSGAPSENFTGDNANVLKQAAASLGASPKDLATVISYETAGKFSPSIRGGKGGNYQGLIQFGPAERAKYGVTGNETFAEQMPKVVRFLKDRGFKPGMGLDKLYATINGGNPYVSQGASDGNGTIAQHVTKMQAQHGARAQAFIDAGSGSGTASSPASGAAGTAVDNAAKLLGAGSSQAAAALGSKMTPGEWCADFVNGSLKSANIKGVNSSIANSFMGWGQQVLDGVKKGDVVVEHRGGGVGQTGGHVGLATGRVKHDDRTGRDFIETISGNHGNQVAQSWVEAGRAMVRRSEQALVGKPGTYGKPQDIGDGMTSSGWKKAGAEDLVAESPAQKLARSAPKMPGGTAGGGGSAKIEVPIHINHIGDAQSTANAVQRRIQDVSGYHTQDRSYESI